MTLVQVRNAGDTAYITRPGTPQAATAAPNAPRNVAAQVVDVNAARVTWNAPDSANGAPVHAYELSVTGASPPATFRVGPAVRDAVIGGLGASAYTLSVKALSGFGASAAATVDVDLTPPAPPVDTAPLLYPAAAWTGVAGSGAPAPAGDGDLVGAGFKHTVIANFEEPPTIYLTADLDVTVIAIHGDCPAQNPGAGSWGIEKCEFFMEGNTVPITSRTKNARTGAIGFKATLKYANFASDGDALMYAVVTPVNGRKKRIGPIQVVRLPDANRAKRFIDPAGADSNDGLTVGTPWQTVNKACVSAPSGAIVACAAGTYPLDGAAGTTNAVSRPIEFRPGAGAVRGDVIFKRNARGQAQFAAAKVWFSQIKIEMSGVRQLRGMATNGEYVWDRCDLVDDNGVAGPTDTWAAYPGVRVQVAYDAITELTYAFYPNNGQHYSLLECIWRSHNCGGAHLYRGTLAEVAWDSVEIGFGKTPAISGFTVRQPVSQYRARGHKATTLHVATASYDAPTNQTTLTFSEPSGASEFVAFSSSQGAKLTILDGPLGGTDNVPIASQTTAGVIKVTGDRSTIGVGTAVRSFIVSHADSLQFGMASSVASPNTSRNNTVVQRYDSQNWSHQLWLLQAGAFTAPGTISTVGTALTSSVAHQLTKDDCIRVSVASSDPNYRYSVFIESVDSPTTATLSRPFLVDVSAKPWQHGKTIMNVGIQLSKLREVSQNHISGAEYGQRHIVIEQTIWDQYINLKTSNAPFGIDGSIFRNNILNRSSSTDGCTPDNNHYTVGPAVGTNASVGPVAYGDDGPLQTAGPDADGLYNLIDGVPVSGVTRTLTAPFIPFDFDGEPVDGTNLVGCMKA